MVLVWAPFALSAGSLQNSSSTLSPGRLLGARQGISQLCIQQLTRDFPLIRDTVSLYF